MKKTFAKFLAIASLALAFAAPAQANFVAGSYDWEYSGVGVTASGVLTVAGNATTPEAVMTFNGQRNGVDVDGLVPLGTDGRFLYDNMFSTVAPEVSWFGILFSASGLNFNLYSDQGLYREVFFDNSGAVIDHAVSFQVTQTVPEPETVALLLVGLGLIGFQLSKRKATMSTSVSAGQSFA